MTTELDWSKYHETLKKKAPVTLHGKVMQVVGITIEGFGVGSFVGELCDIYARSEDLPIKAEVIGFRDNRVVLMPLGEVRGIGPGSRITGLNRKATVSIGEEMLGRVIDGLGNPIDDKGALSLEKTYPLYADPINPLHRRRIKEPLDVGIKAVNALLTCGKGQRMGIFSGSGVGVC